MKQTALCVGLFLLLAPSLALAQAIPSCSAQGYTVVFVNGVFDTEFDAQQDKKALQDKLHSQYNGQSITVQLGYNPTHLAGVGDFFQGAAQLFSKSISNFDLDTVLLEIYPEVTTRKLMLVGHSQGAFYTNDMYSYLLAHGEPKEAVAVYNFASPATYTAGGGKYLNSSGDSVLRLLSVANKNILPDNIDLIPVSTGMLSGHSFVEDYLDGASDRVQSEMDGELSALVPTDAYSNSDCFTPPTISLGYQAQQVGFAIADPTATALKVGVVTTYTAGAVAFKVATTFAIGAMQLVADALTLSAAPPTDAQATVKTDAVINKLYGSSVNGLSAQDKKDLLGSSQGGAVALALAPAPKKVAATSGVVLGTSTEVAPTPPAPTPAPSIFPSSSNGPVYGGGGAPAAPAPVAAAPAAAPSDPVVDSAPVVDAPVVDTPPADPTPPTTSDPVTPPPTVGPIIASQEDSSATPSHYWHSDGSSGAYLALDPSSGAPGYPIGVITTTSNVLGIHIKAAFTTDGAFSNLPTFVRLFDESGNTPYACSQPSFAGYAYGTASDAATLSNPLTQSQFEGTMVDMYFQCALGNGHDQTTAGTSYRLYVYPVSTVDVSDIYVAMGASGVPFYEVSLDGTF